MEVEEPFKRRKLPDQILDRLSAAITRGDFAIGDALPSERELMNRFGVGRPAVREALQALANFGLIDIVHGERARLVALTPEALINQIDFPAKLMLSGSKEALDHLVEARLFLDCGMVRVAATNATASQVAGLQEILKLQASALSDIDSFIAHDMAFHIAIARIAANPIYVVMAQAMLGWLREYHIERLHWSGRENVTLSEHAKIIDCISAHDPVAAEAAMAKHLKRSSELFRHHDAPASTSRTLARR